MSADQAMLKRIAGLLAKAEATEFEEERDAFLAGAHRLMRDHAVTEADLAAANPADAEPTYDLWKFSDDSLYVGVKRMLLTAACRIAGSGTTPVEVIFPAPGHWCAIVGYPTEAAVARLAFPAAWAMTEAAADRAGATNPRVREGYMLGFAQGLMDKLREFERTSPGLVPVSRAERVEAAVDRLGSVDSAPAATLDGVDPATFLAGYAAGAEADVDIGGHAQRLTQG